MIHQAPTTSSVKLGLAVAWPAFWTGVPFKCVAALLMLAMHVQPWEPPGLVFLLLLSVPIDIWALTLCARTVFLERLQVTPPAGFGFTLWWQAMVVSAVYLPVAYFVESQTIAGAQAVAKRIMALGALQGLGIPERISIELVLWSSVATVVLLALVLGWLFVFGRLVRRQAMASTPTREPYKSLIRQWDLMRVPADQPLLLTIFTGVGIFLVVLFWAFMPVTTPHPHELYRKEVVKVQPRLRPDEALQKTEKLIAQAESAVQALEEKSKAGTKDKEKGQEEKVGKESGPSRAEAVKASVKAVKAETVAGRAEAHPAGDHAH